MIRYVANFLSEEEGNSRRRCLDVNVVTFELLDTFGNKLVVMDQWPQVSKRDRGIEVVRLDIMFDIQ